MRMFEDRLTKHVFEGCNQRAESEAIKRRGRDRKMKSLACRMPETIAGVITY